MHIRKAKEKYVLLGLVSFSRASFSFAARRQQVSVPVLVQAATLDRVSVVVAFRLLVVFLVVTLDQDAVEIPAILDQDVPAGAATLDRDVPAD